MARQSNPCLPEFLFFTHSAPPDTPGSGSSIQVPDLHAGAPTKLGHPQSSDKAGLCPQETYKGGGERSPWRTTQGKHADLVKGQKVLLNVREEETALDHCREGSQKR